MMHSERILFAAFGRETDVVPVAPYMGNYGASFSGIPIDQYGRSGSLMAKAQYTAWQEFRQDVLVAQSDNYYIAEGFGCQVSHHVNSTPTLKKPAVEQLKDVFRLKVPDPRQDGRMPVYLEAIQLLSSKLEGKALIRAPGTGPFSLASHLLGTEEFLFQIAMLGVEPNLEREKSLRHLLDLTTEALIQFARACMAAGARIIQAGDSLASPDVISPETYRNWAFPYERRFFSEFQSLADTGRLSLLHICGDTTKILHMMAETGANILELDHKVNLGFARKVVGERVCLMGNVDPAGVLLQGTAALVAERCLEAIDSAGRHGYFILGSGCEVPPKTPKENMHAMIETARSIRYPIGDGSIGTAENPAAHRSSPT